MNHIDKEILEQWLEKADHDLIAVGMILESKPIILDIACFHCQQASERILSNRFKRKRNCSSKDQLLASKNILVENEKAGFK